jgi:UDP-GlcNAc:undecaprenyl-phosphate GlcNAc-1-phosphate transferase
MGDSGSQFLGFALGFLVVYLVQVANPAASAALPLLLLGLPVTDILAVLYQRALAGMNWFKATRNHVHHRLLDLGFTHYESVVSIYSLQAALVVSGVVLRYQSDLLVTTAYLLPMAGLFAALLAAERGGWRLGSAMHARVLRFPDSLQRVIRNAWVRRAPLWFISAVVPLFMSLAALWVADVPRDFGAIAGLVAVVLAVDMLRGKTAGSLILRTAVYVAAAFSAYLFIRNPGVRGVETTHWVNLIMFALAAALGLYIRFLSEQKFGTTPTDYLIALGVVALATFDRLDIQTGGILPFVTYAIVLFYGCEVIVGHMARWRYVLGWPTLVALVILAGRGLGGLI